MRAETVSIVIGTNAAPRVEFGAEKLVEVLKAVNLDASIVQSEKPPGRKIHLETPHDPGINAEGFRFDLMGNNDIVITSGGDSGTLYGCLELAQRIHDAGKLPAATIARTACMNSFLMFVSRSLVDVYVCPLTTFEGERRTQA